MFTQSFKKLVLTATLGATLSMAAVSAQAGDGIHAMSQASGASIAAPIAIVSVGASAVVATAGVVTIKSVQLIGTGTRVVVENVARGVAATLEFTGKSAGAFAAGIGDTLRVVPLTTGIVFYEAKRAVAWVPNDRGANLSHNERLTQ